MSYEYIGVAEGAAALVAASGEGGDWLPRAGGRASQPARRNRTSSRVALMPMPDIMRGFEGERKISQTPSVGEQSGWRQRQIPNSNKSRNQKNPKARRIDTAKGSESVLER